MPLPFKKNSLLFAPMEGVTDGPYRKVISQLYPEWDYFFTDFYRVPRQGKISEKSIIGHFGTEIFNHREIRQKTGFQILTSPGSQTLRAAEIIDGLGLQHLDLNLGCPSKKVNSHQGGAYLLSDLAALAAILKTIRTHFRGIFTIKIRAGYKDDQNFANLIRLAEAEGIDAITIHGRTRDQLYKGSANWNYIKRACELTNLPIIGNGDLWNIHDIGEMFEMSNCYAVMLGRGALKTPWLASTYYQYSNHDVLTEDLLLNERCKEIKHYFDSLRREYSYHDRDERQIVKRFKSFSHYLFDDFENGLAVKSYFLRSENLTHFVEGIHSIDKFKRA